MQFVYANKFRAYHDYLKANDKERFRESVKKNHGCTGLHTENLL